MFGKIEVFQALQSIPWFLELKPKQIENLTNISEICTLSPGEILFEEGDLTDNLYILLEGNLNIETQIPTSDQPLIALAEPLDILGWSSLTPVTRQRTATVRATKESVLIGFSSTALLQICDEDHDLGFVIMRRVANVIASHYLRTKLQFLNFAMQQVPK